MKRKSLALLTSIIFTISTLQSFNPVVKSVEPVSVTIGALGAVAVPIVATIGGVMTARYRYKAMKAKAEVDKTRCIQPVPSGQVTHAQTNDPQLQKTINQMARRKSTIWAKRGFPLKPLLEDTRIIGKERLAAPENSEVISALYDLVEYIKGEIRLRANSVKEARRFVQYFAHFAERVEGDTPQESTGLDADHDIFGATFRLILDDGTTRYITIAFAPEHGFNMPKRKPLMERSKQELLQTILEGRSTKRSIKSDLFEMFGPERSRTRSDVQSLGAKLYSLMSDLVDEERLRRVRVARGFERFIDPDRLLKLAKRSIVELPNIPCILGNPRISDDGVRESEDSSPDAIHLGEARWHSFQALSRSASMPFAASSAQLPIEPAPPQPWLPQAFADGDEGLMDLDGIVPGGLAPAPPTEIAATLQGIDGSDQSSEVRHIRFSYLAWLVDKSSSEQRFIDLKLLRRYLSHDPQIRQRRQRAALIQNFAVNVVDGKLDMVIAVKNGKEDIDESTGFPYWQDLITPADSKEPMIPITITKAAQLTSDARRCDGMMARYDASLQRGLAMSAGLPRVAPPTAGSLLAIPGQDRSSGSRRSRPHFSTLSRLNPLHTTTAQLLTAPRRQLETTPTSDPTDVTVDGTDLEPSTLPQASDESLGDSETDTDT